MYSLYILTQEKFLPIGDDTGIKRFGEEDLHQLQEHQTKSYAIGRPMWIVYKKE